MIYPKLSDGTIDWCDMCKHEGSDFYDLCCMCNYGEKEDDPPTCYESKPVTNGDKLRAMTDEELAELVTDDMCELLCGAPLVCEGQRKQKMLDWLRREAE